MLMLNIGDRVQHKQTGRVGQIIGYGYQKITDSYYLTTLKVELFKDSPVKPTIEDLFNQWQAWQDKRDFNNFKLSNRSTPLSLVA
jgi:hypothetical protein